MIEGLGDMNFSLILSAIGSALGTGVAGMAAIGAWKKAFALNKASPEIKNRKSFDFLLYLLYEEKVKNIDS